MTTWPDGKPKSSGNAFDVPQRSAVYAAVREYINRVKGGQASAAATNGGERFMHGAKDRRPRGKA
mgnify:CR=1 FL=1